jgi:hypothetical protein
MAFLSKLKVDDESYNVITARYAIEKPTDDASHPSGRIQGGRIILELESTKNVSLFDWAATEERTKNGELILYNRDSFSIFRKIKFTNAYCIRFEEFFNSSNTEPVYCEIILACHKMEIKDAKFNNEWPIDA